MQEIMTLRPQYQVELIKRNRAHFYRVVKAGIEYEFPGVTGTLDIIGGDKTQRLIGWAKKQSLEQVRKILSEFPLPNDGILHLKPEVIEDIIARAKKKPVDELENAADLGSRFHRHCDQIIKGQLVDEPADDLMNPVLAFQSWIKQNGITIIQGDTAVASIRHRYGGSFDFIFEKDGSLGIGDVKTSNSIHESMGLQVAAYCTAAEEVYDEHFYHAMIIRFDKHDPVWECKYVKNVGKCFDAFLHAKHLKDLLTEEIFK